MKIAIVSIKILERIRKDVRNVEELSANIAKNGLITPIAVMRTEGGEFQLLAGLRRIRAVQMLGWTEIESNVLSAKDAEESLNIEISENEQREEFTSEEKLDYARQLERIEAAKSRERMLSGKKSDGSDPTDRGPQGKRETRDIVGAKISLSGRQYDRLKYINENAPNPHEVLAEIDSEKKSIRGVYDELKAKEKAEKAKTEPTKPIALPKREHPAELAAPTLPAKTESSADNNVADVAVFSAAEPDDEAVARFDVEVGDELDEPDELPFNGDSDVAEEPASVTEPEAATPAEPAPDTTDANAPVPAPEKPKRLSAAQRLEEKAMAALPPKQREAAERLKTFHAMTDKEKVVELERQLREERARVAVAETGWEREKELHYNNTYHMGGTIESQGTRLENLAAEIDRLTAENVRLLEEKNELTAALEAANAKITELEGR